MAFAQLFFYPRPADAKRQGLLLLVWIRRLRALLGLACIFSAYLDRQHY